MKKKLYKQANCFKLIYFCLHLFFSIFDIYKIKKLGKFLYITFLNKFLFKSKLKYKKITKH